MLFLIACSLFDDGVIATTCEDIDACPVQSEDSASLEDTSSQDTDSAVPDDSGEVDLFFVPSRFYAHADFFFVNEETAFYDEWRNTLWLLLIDPAQNSEFPVPEDGCLLSLSAEAWEPTQEEEAELS